MRRSPEEDIVDFLSFSNDAPDCANEFLTISQRRWKHLLQWLDDSGLALYFLQRLKDTSRTSAVPAGVTLQLEQNFIRNRRRVDDMARRFNSLNSRFDDAGVCYAVIKGVSLVPEFCPDARLRHQGDFDYLVDERSLLVAERIIVEAGYASKQSQSKKELAFVIPGGQPSRDADQYSAHAPHAVELHLDIWDSDMHRLPPLPRLFAVKEAVTHHWSGLTFPALNDADAFLLQILHVCHHLFTLWVRMANLFEIGYFLNRRSLDAALWNRIEQRVGDNLLLREFVVVVVEMVTKVFAAPAPPLVRAWLGGVRPETRVWIENYARQCAFSGLPAYQFKLFPSAKLVLFLHQQYRDNASVGRHLVGQRLLPSSRLSRMALSIRSRPSVLFEARWWKRHMIVRRSIFHALAGLRYVCEIPRWRWLNRASLQAASASWTSNSLSSKKAS